ncbi:MAG: hypothetical protein K2K23_10510 [Muribaculaceae bacterium]|nr:hypothetical protein [Muribaculaceae bacterium]
MKRVFSIVSAIILLVVALSTSEMQAIRTEGFLKRGDPNNTDNTDKIAMAYVVDRFPNIPDAAMYSHLIYASALFNDNLDGIVIRYPEKLKAMSELKKQNPDLKVILCLSDFRRAGFCEMTADKKKRKAYVKNVYDVIRAYNLDGVDLDWEFPTTEGGGHTASPQDDRNYVKLAKDLRRVLGKDAWISYYSNFSGKWIDHKGMLPYVSYVNVSGYNLAAPREGEPMLHHSPLYSSPTTGERCIANVIEHHIDLGIPKEKILIGIPFFGKGISPLPMEVGYIDFAKYCSGLRMKWDEDAQAPFFSDENGNLILGFDNERSISAKFDFIRTNQLPGVFVWCYDFDSIDHKLGRTIEKLRVGHPAIPSDSLITPK